MNIAMITSGGDAPGMNPCIADLVLSGQARGHHMFIYERGYVGIKNNWIRPIYPQEVYGLHRRGGSFIKSGRLPELKDPATGALLVKNLTDHQIDALIVLGGDGSFRGALSLSQISGSINFVGIPCTIDNDIYGSDYTLGYDTALNKMVTYIDDISDTASSMYPRIFFIETLGGADSLFPRIAHSMQICDIALTHQSPKTPEEVCEEIQQSFRRQDKDYVLVTVAEQLPHLQEIMDYVQSKLGIAVKYNCIGYQQRGGTPTALERIHAAGFARLALEAVEKRRKNQYVIFHSGTYDYLAFAAAGKKKAAIL